MAQSAQVYSDHKVTTVVFPSVEPSVELVYRIQRERKVPLFPGAFFAQHSFAREYDFRNVSVKVSAPASLPIFAESRGLQGCEAKGG